MIPDKVRNIFTFIDFLDSNKNSYVEKYVPLTNSVLQLNGQRSKLSPSRNYKEKQQYDVIQKEIEKQFVLIENNVVKPVLDKLLNLKIWEGDSVYISIYNNNTGAIAELTKNFIDADIEEIKEYKQKYLDFRTDTNCNFISLASMFDNLDELLKILFDFFKDAEKNEFEAFEIMPLQVSGIGEAVKLFQKGHTKFTLPVEFSKPSKIQQDTNGALQLDDVTVKDLLSFLESAGEVIRPAKIEFCDDGTHKVTAWHIGKSIDELYKEKVEEIEKVISGYKQRCYSRLNNQELKLLELNLKEVIRLFKDENNVFKDNPDYQKKINEQFEKAANRLEGFLNDVVLPKIEYRKANTIKPKELEISDAIKKGTEGEFSYIEKRGEQTKFIADEYALAYILDLYADGRQVPKNRVEGSYDAKELKRIGKEVYEFEKPDTFYRAVKKVAKYDLNTAKYLEAISKDWLGAVKALSKNWGNVSEYLKGKQLFKE